MMSMGPKVLFILGITCLGYQASLAQQKTIKIIGKVINAKDKKPVAGATVYLSNTTIGTVTSEMGSFTLDHVPPGNYKLIASFLGYRTLSVAVSESNKNEPVTLALHQDVNRLKGITVRAKRRKDKNRSTYFEYFKKGFIGTDANANDCKIINPQALHYSFDGQSKILSAVAYEPLIINNKALGYRIYYELDSFSFDLGNDHISYFGYPRFEELPAKNSRQQKRWYDNRIETYGTSMRYFMLLLASKQIEQHQIEMNKLVRNRRNSQNRSSFSVSFGQSSNPLKDLGSHVGDSLFPQQASYDSVIYTNTKTGIVKLKFTNSLRVRIPRYTPTKPGMTVMAFRDNGKNRPDKTRTEPNLISIITMIKPETIIDANGVLTDPLAITIEGYWANRQVADLLPFDYRLPE